eukprot:8361028-Alexandrium_andersonii.AAC.1
MENDSSDSDEDMGPGRGPERALLRASWTTTPPWPCRTCSSRPDVGRLTAPWRGQRSPQGRSHPEVGVHGLIAAAAVPGGRV